MAEANFSRVKKAHKHDLRIRMNHNISSESAKSFSVGRLGICDADATYVVHALACQASGERAMTS